MLQRLFDAMPHAVVLVDESGQIARANTAAENQFGYTAEQFATLTVESLIPAEARDDHLDYRANFHADPHNRIMAKGACFEAERADGSRFAAEVNLEPMKVDGKTLTWAVIKDVTKSSVDVDTSEHERSSLIDIGKLATSAVDFQSRQREFGRLIRSLVPNHSTIISALKPDGQNQHVVYADYLGQVSDGYLENGSTWPVEGTTAEEVISTEKPVIRNFVDSNEYLDNYAGMKNRPDLAGIRAVMNVPLFANGQLFGFLTFRSSSPQDYSISDLRRGQSIADLVAGPVAQMELRRRQIEADKETNEAKSHFIGMLSHELKTPLTSITAFSDLLHKNKAGNFSKRELQQLDAIKRNSRLLESLIVDLLDLSKLESGNVILTAQVVNPIQLIDECVEELDGALVSKSQTVVVEVQDQDAAVIADLHRLRQVLINILNNASKYGPEDSSIYITSTVKDESLHVSVRDQGPGIPPEDAENIFDLFNRGQSTSVQQQQPGTGIGLYVARRIIEAHGGKISIKSLEEGGSIAEFIIPRIAIRELDGHSGSQVAA